MHIHFIGICGVAMSALAIAFHKQGHTVTGSDKGFYPPVSDHLKKQKISFYPGWHVDKMTQNGNPDLVIVGNVAGSSNPEWLYVQEHGLKYQSYPEAVAEFLIQDTSIVCAGSYGKTTTTTLLAWIFSECKKNPNYMFGGLLQSHMPAAALSDSNISIVEGDEYKTARWDERAKFYHYKPTELLLTAVEWDHADLYPTCAAYTKAFHDLVEMIPSSGRIIYADSLPDQIIDHIEDQHAESISYGLSEDALYRAKDIEMSLDGMRFTIETDDADLAAETTLLGDYNAKNIAGCVAMALAEGLDTDAVLAAVKSFPGIKRRLERRGKGKVAIFDDIAHSPAKASSTLKTLKAVATGKVIAVFEPNTGNRQAEAIPAYDNAFADADTVLIGRLSTVKRDPNKPAPLDGQGLTDVIAKTHEDARYIADDDALVATLKELSAPGDVVVFLGSHGFRGMIEDSIHALH